MTPLFVSNKRYQEALSRIDGLNGTFSTAAFSVYKIQTTQASGIQLHNDMAAAEHQVSSMVAASEEISASISEVNAGVVHLSEETGRLKDALNSGEGAVTTSEQEMQAIEDRVVELQSTVLDLKERVGEIVHVAEVIQGIASQTNLLALNAAIEAARAGEAGMGFAVVAEEVRKLADETHKQSEGITKSIREVAASIDTTVELTRQSVTSVEAGRQANNDIRESYNAIIGVADSVTKMTGETQCQLEEQRTATEMIVQSSEELARLVSSISSVADYLNSTTGICVDKTKQVWQSLLGLRADMHTFILDRIIDHAMWLKKLADAITSGDASAELADHRSCKLGKWYLSSEGKALRGIGSEVAAVFDALDGPHAELHNTGIAAIEAAKRGDEHTAHEKMLAAFANSARVVDLLVELAGKIVAKP